MKNSKTTALAVCFVITFLAPAFGQSEEQKVYGIGDIAERQMNAPAWVIASHDDVRSTALAQKKRGIATRDVGTPVATRCNNDFLTGMPALSMPIQESTVSLTTGCDIPAGSWFIVQVDYGSSGAGENWKTTKVVPAGSVIQWNPTSAFKSGGGMFTLTVISTTESARQLTTSFDAPVPIQSAFEQISSNLGQLQRILVVQGANFGLRALFGGVDITNQPAPTTTGVAFNITNLNLVQGVTYPLTLAASDGSNGTVLIFHPDCRNGCGFQLPVLSSVSITKNSSVGDLSIPAGITNVRIGSYTVTARSTTLISNVGIATNVQGLQNLRIVASSGAQFGTTQGTVGTGTTYLFSGQITIPAGSTINLDVYADITASANGTFNPGTFLQSITAIDVTSSSLIPTPTGVAGQGINISQAPPAISIFVPAAAPGARNVIMGSTGNLLATFYVGNIATENVRVSDVTIADNTSSLKIAFSNLQLWQNGVLVGTAGFAQPTTGHGYLYSFHFSAPFVVPTDNTSVLELRGDVSSYPSGNAEDNSLHSVGIIGAQAIGTNSGRAATIEASRAFGATLTVLRTELTVSTSASGGIQHFENSLDELGKVTFFANSAGPASLNKITVTFAGSAAFAVSSANVTLIDSNGINVAALSAGGTAIDGTARTFTWFMSNYVIPPGSSATFTLRVNSTALTSGSSLTAVIANQQDVLYTDGLDFVAVSGLTLSPSVLPVVINAVTYR